MQEIKGSFKTWIKDGNKKRHLVIIKDKIYLDGNLIERIL